MAKSDVLLRDDRVSVVGGGAPEVEGGRETGDLEVSIGENKDPSVTLNADRANITLGGGDGAAPEGDLKLLDGGERNRVQITAEGGNRPSVDENRVWIDGGTGELELSTERSGEESAVRISADQGEFVDAEINVGGPVTGGTVDGAAHITAIAGEGDAGPAGTAGFSDYGRIEESVSIRGDSALLSLGYSVTRKTVQNAPDTDAEGPYGVGGNTSSGSITYERVAGENGKIFFDDGHGSNIRVIAEDGKLKIGGDSDYDGEFDQEFLVVDPENKEIRTPWTFVEE